MAAEYGFRGGLVPGVTVYGYMTVPIVDSEPAWLERGSMHVRFLEPVYDGEEIVVRAEANEDGSMDVLAEREDGTVCAKGHASTEARSGHVGKWYAEHPLPSADRRPVPSPDNLIVYAPLGTVVEKLSLLDASFLDRRSERLPIYHGSIERKGHEFVVADVMLVANAERLVQTVRHTAIYRPRTS